jgi:hypothetical protein
MVAAQEPIVHEHLILDTTTNPPDKLAAKLNDYWLKAEQESQSPNKNSDLQFYY